MRRAMAAFSAAALLTVPITDPAQAIVTRHDVEPTAYRADAADFPFLASLFTTPDGHRDCVATLIASQWLITAQHCVAEPGLDAEVASASFHVHFAGGERATVSRIIRMPESDGPPLRNDVALLKLAEPVTGIAPVRLYDGEQEVGRVVFFAGWGGTGSGVAGLGEEDGLFRVAENRVEAVFDNFIVFRFDDPRTHLGRAVPLEGISGPGDSGGPALLPTPHGFHLVGISSSQRTYGADQGTYNVDEYYVRISAVSEWIESVIGTG